MNTDKAREALIERITAYLAGGGLFNPELADHDAVSQLLIDCRALTVSEHDTAQANATTKSRLTKALTLRRCIGS